MSLFSERTKVFYRAVLTLFIPIRKVTSRTDAPSLEPVSSDQKMSCYHTVNAIACIIAIVLSSTVAFGKDEPSSKGEIKLDDSLRQKLDAVFAKLPLRSNTSDVTEPLMRELKSLETAYKPIDLMRQLILYGEATNNELYAITSEWMLGQLAQTLKKPMLLPLLSLCSTTTTKASSYVQRRKWRGWFRSLANRELISIRFTVWFETIMKSHMER